MALQTRWRTTEFVPIFKDAPFCLCHPFLWASLSMALLCPVGSQVEVIWEPWRWFFCSLCCLHGVLCLSFPSLLLLLPRPSPVRSFTMAYVVFCLPCPFQYHLRCLWIVWGQRSISLVLLHVPVTSTMLGLAHTFNKCLFNGPLKQLLSERGIFLQIPLICGGQKWDALTFWGRTLVILNYRIDVLNFEVYFIGLPTWCKFMLEHS